MNDFDFEASLFRDDVDAEAARLVRLGVPPWDAMIQARQRVTRNRQQKARDAKAPSDNGAV